MSTKIVRRASKQVGMIYHCCWHVWPLLEYASQLWDPHEKVLIHSLEMAQKFSLRMSCKQWRSEYESLLVWAYLPSLKPHRFIAKLCYLNNMLHAVMHSSIPLPKPRIVDSRPQSFQDSMLLHPSKMIFRSSRLHDFQDSMLLHTRTTFYKSSFILHQLPYGIIYPPGCVTVLI